MNLLPHNNNLTPTPAIRLFQHPPHPRRNINIILFPPATNVLAPLISPTLSNVTLKQSAYPFAASSAVKLSLAACLKSWRHAMPKWVHIALKKKHQACA
ncbi:hypothetical protein EJ02DRAFT_450660 [Clathrospora elynae]|uniref:Uncharacterized protein n=1 Tax=Clathrospora elynae TaxID=706981 RepID=A0A6A5T0Y8_9PLEO|nr:hypothetical protein EJ02DRAFT_450660 [Clathrospora elynae]